MISNSIVSWLLENFHRFFNIKSPIFFKRWTVIWLSLIAVTGLPELLTWFEVYLPEPWNTKLSKLVMAASSGALFMSKLTTQSKAIAVMNDGKVLKKTDEIKLPFTAKEEAKEAEKVIQKSNGGSSATMVTILEPKH